MKKEYSVLEEKTLFEGVVFDVVERDIEVRVPTGNGLDEVDHIKRQVVTYGDSVLIVPVTKDGKLMYLGEEYRTVVNGTQIGFPAGRIDPEDPTYVTAVHRELREELGIHMAEGTQPIHLFSAYASLGYTLEQIHAYMVYVDPIDDETVLETEFDADEYVELRVLKTTDVEELIRNGIINSMSAQLAFMKTVDVLANEDI